MWTRDNECDRYHHTVSHKVRLLNDTLNIVVKRPPAYKKIEHERNIAKINQSMAQADARYDLIVKGFDDLFSAMSEMAAADPKAFKLFLIQTNEFMEKRFRIDNFYITFCVLEIYNEEGFKSPFGEPKDKRSR